MKGAMGLKITANAALISALPRCSRGLVFLPLFFVVIRTPPPYVLPFKGDGNEERNSRDRRGGDATWRGTEFGDIRV